MNGEDANRINGAFRDTNEKISKLEAKINNLNVIILQQNQKIESLTKMHQQLLVNTYTGGSTCGD